MNRLTLTAMIGTIFLMVLAKPLLAQDLSFGGRLGLTGGGVLFEDEESSDLIEPQAGFQIGAVAAYGSSSILSLQAELWFIQKGWVETQSGGGRRLSYVELPLFLTVTAPWKTAPQLLLGVSGSFELGCSVTGLPGVGRVSCDDPRVDWHHTKALFGTWAGLGVRRRFDRNQLDLQLLINLNLTNLNRDPLPRGYTRLLSFMISAVYSFEPGGTSK